MSPQLQVADLERAIAFYTEKLGFALDFRYEDFYAGIVKDGFSVHLKLTDEPVVIKQHTDDSPLDIMFSVENIQDLYNDLSARSVQVVQSLRQMPYGSEFYIADLDGNMIAFIEN